MSENIDPVVVDQQRRVVLQGKNVVQGVVDTLNQAQSFINTYNRLGLAEGLLEGSFEGTGTNIGTLRDAVASLQALVGLLEQGHGTNLEKLAR